MPVRATARLKYVSIPPRKMRLVADTVKGLPVEKALNLLNFTPRVAAHHLAKTLKSAAANALSQEGTAQLKPENLRIKKIVIDNAPTAKRIRFQSMGRVFRIRKRYCHLTVVVEEHAQPRPVPAGEREKEKSGKVEHAAKGRRKSPRKKTAGKRTAGRSTASHKTAPRKATVKGRAAKKATTKKVTAGKTSARPKKSAGDAE